MKRSLGLFTGICLVCCSQASAQTPARRHSLIEFRPARLAPAPGYALVKSIGDTSYYVADSVVVSDDDIADARADTSALNGLVIKIRLKAPAAVRFQEFTERHLRNHLAVFLNGALSGSPALIVDTLSGGTFTLVGRPAGDVQQFAAAVAARWHSGH